MALTTAQQTLIEQRVTNDGPSIVVAYLLWLFLGTLSGHRFYLGQVGIALLQILSVLFVIGLVWVLIDVFLIPGMIRERQNDMRRDLAAAMETLSGD